MKESESLTVVHPVIPGERVLFIGETREGIISLSNFRKKSLKGKRIL